MSDEDDWQEIWDARIDALCRIFGPSHDNVYHAPHPFQLGGQADVVAFFNTPHGAVYVTSELSGKPNASYADYELMICHRSPSDWGPNLISRLAPYTQQAYIHHGDTMDIAGVAPSGSAIAALLFQTFDSFELFGERFDLRLCIGITQPELNFKLENGHEKLTELLKQKRIFPFTDLERDSVPLDPPRSGDRVKPGA